MQVKAKELTSLIITILSKTNYLIPTHLIFRKCVFIIATCISSMEHMVKHYSITLYKVI